jgi:small subunit ribosomal protein S24e
MIKMDLEVIEEKDNMLLNRRELKLKIYHDAATPSRVEVKQNVGMKFNADPDLVIIDKMKSEFGKSETRAYVKIYETIEAAKLVEREHILKRNTPAVTGGVVDEEE